MNVYGDFFVRIWVSFVVLSINHVEGTNEDCLCSPSCQTNGRSLHPNCILTVRQDCQCCTVCAGLSGDQCHNVTQPCDKDFYCNDVTKKCTSDIDVVSSLENVRNNKDICTVDSKTHEVGSVLYMSNCTSVCECRTGGSFKCASTKCPAGLVRKGLLADDPFCEEKSPPSRSVALMSEQEVRSLECCVLTICSNDDTELEDEDDDYYYAYDDDKTSKRDDFIVSLRTPTPLLHGCLFKNVSYQTGEIFDDGCEQRCTCNGFDDINCSPRCPVPSPVPAALSSGQNCVVLSDVSDECCYITVCQNDSGQNVQRREIGEAPLSSIPQSRINHDVSKSATHVAGRIGDLSKCVHNNVSYTLGSMFYDGCESFCECTHDDYGEIVVACNSIECPSDFGLDVINPLCIKWQAHADFEPKPPLCCPPTSKCVADGSCQYKGHKFNNFDSIPANLSGCLSRCYCEDGKVDCRDACYERSEKPPSFLPCTSSVAIVKPDEERPCCFNWACPAEEADDLPNTIGSVSIISVNSSDAVLSLLIPTILYERYGELKVVYTHETNNRDIASWPRVVFTWPESEKENLSLDQASNRVSFTLHHLLPKKTYLVQASFIIQDNMGFNRTLTSDISSFDTIASIVYPVLDTVSIEHIEDMMISVSHITINSATISWRSFSDLEIDVIEGVIIRYYSFLEASSAISSPLITNHNTTTFILNDLDSTSRYVVDLFIIPKSWSPINSLPFSITFITADDLGSYDITLSVDHVTSSSIFVSWSGIPSPPEKYVSLYSIQFVEGNLVDNIITDAINIRNTSISRTTLTGLRQDTLYTLWMEVYLRNGRVLQSNRLNVDTLIHIKDDNTQLPWLGDKEDDLMSSKYYDLMVMTSVIAAMSILALVVITVLYVKRNITYKAVISGKPQSINVKSGNTWSIGRNSSVVEMDDPSRLHDSNNKKLVRSTDVSIL